MTRARFLFAVTTLSGVLLAGAPALAGSPLQSEMAGPESIALMDRADQSFSPIPFGSRSPPEGMVSIDPARCETESECEWRDARGVQHYYWEGELVVKMVTVANLGDRPISALGIGSARAMDEVLRNVRTFVPEVKVTCRQDGDGHDCGATLGEGWFRLFFDASGGLTEVRLDAYHFT